MIAGTAGRDGGLRRIDIAFTSPGRASARGSRFLHRRDCAWPITLRFSPMETRATFFRSAMTSSEPG
ncbi:hypothetical protein [Lysobacter enzymogenes]|uniref:hypothetical protein n=1 Tax=Lysobacter enzymogenes TaxID=69 RepID=UPI0019CF6AEE|nr:hypothetical protein [Lysobacter enzymogenes]